MFREPIRELYLELFPQDRDDEASDSTVSRLTLGCLFTAGLHSKAHRVLCRSMN